MEKTINYITLILVVLLFGIYIAREITKSEYSNQLDKIEAIKDSLDMRAKVIDDQLKERDAVLIQQITTSKNAIEDLIKRAKVPKEEADSFQREMDSLINEFKIIKAAQK